MRPTRNNAAGARDPVHRRPETPCQRLSGTISRRERAATSPDRRRCAHQDGGPSAVARGYDTRATRQTICRWPIGANCHAVLARQRCFVSGFFSTCSQLWAVKIGGFDPLFSMSSQLWHLLRLIDLKSARRSYHLSASRSALLPPIVSPSRHRLPPRERPLPFMLA